MGKSIKSTLVGIKDFGKGLVTGAMNFARMAIAMRPVIIEFITLALPIIAVIAGIIALVAAVSWAADKLSNLNPMNWFKKKEGDTSIAGENKQNLEDQLTEQGLEENGSISKQIESKTQPNILPSTPGTTDNEQLMMPRQNILQRQITPITGGELNRLSVDNIATRDKAASNMVVAPTTNTQNISNNSQTVMTMEPGNFDRSFINLNSPAIPV